MRFVTFLQECSTVAWLRPPMAEPIAVNGNLVGRITEIVCQYFDIDEQSFNSTKRTREVAQARQIAMYLAKQHTKLPLAAIGSAIGGRNHATVLHSCKNVVNLTETDKVLKSQLEELEKLIAKG